MQTTRTIKTKASARSEAQTTTVTLNWDGVTDDNMREMAESWAAIKLQIGWRKNGIPATTTVNVKDIVPGTRAPRTPQTIESLFAAMSADEQKWWLRAQIEAIERTLAGTPTTAQQVLAEYAQQ